MRRAVRKGRSGRQGVGQRPSLDVMSSHYVLSGLFTEETVDSVRRLFHPPTKILHSSCWRVQLPEEEWLGEGVAVLCVFPSLPPPSSPPVCPCPLSGLWDVVGQWVRASQTQRPCAVWCAARCFSLVLVIHSRSRFLFVTPLFPLVIACSVISSLYSQMSLHIYHCWRITQLLRLHFGTYLLHWGVSYKNISQKMHNRTYWRSKSAQKCSEKQGPLVPKSRGVGCACQPSIGTVGLHWHRGHISQVPSKWAVWKANPGLWSSKVWGFFLVKRSQSLCFESCVWNEHSQKSHWGVEKRSSRPSQHSQLMQKPI